MGEGTEIARSDERSCPQSYSINTLAARKYQVASEIRLAEDTGKAGLGSAVQGICVGQLVAIAKSDLAVADLYLCVFGCAKNQAELENRATS